MRKKVLILLTNILIVSSTLTAGKVDRAFEALKVYNYFKAKELFEKAFNTKSLTASYGLSVIYSRNDNPFYQLDSAKKYINFANKAIDSTNQKQIKQLKKYKLSFSDFHLLENSINAKKFNLVLQNNTIKDYNFFILNYPNASQFDAAVSLRNELAFDQAKKNGTPEAYYMFLERYPNAAQKVEAKANYELSLFESITKSDSIESYIAFLHQYPNSPFVNKAQNLIYEKVTAAGSVDSYVDFVNRFEDNRNINKAWRNIYKLYIKDFSAERIAEFRLDFPKYPFMDELMVDFQLASIQFYPIQRDNKFGYVDEKGNQMISFLFDWAEVFIEGGAIVERNDMLGVINKQGDYLIPSIYDDIVPFSNGIAIVGLDGKYGLVNKLNQLVTPLMYDQIESFVDGVALVENNGRFGFINRSGEIAIPIQYSSAGSFENGFAYAEKDDKKGIINLKGEVVINYEHDWIEVFNKEGLARAKKNNKYGVYANNGSLLVDFKYDNIGEFSNGYALVADSLKYTFINTKGEFITEFVFDFRTEALSFSKFDVNGFAKVITKDKIGIIDTSGEKVVPAIFEAIGDYNSSGLTAVRKKEKWGYMNADTRLVIPYQFQVAEKFNNGKAIVKSEVGWSVLSIIGELLINDKYTLIKQLNGVGFLLYNNDNVDLVDFEFSPLLNKSYQSIEVLNEEMLKLHTINSVELYNRNLKKSSLEIINDFNLFRTQLINKLGQELPGESSHNKLMSYIRPTATEIKKSSDYRESAVLALIYFINLEPYLVFILRQSYQGVHSAQVSFPGGKKESSDSTLIETALREAEEEISVIAKEVEILGSLTEIYVPPSNFLISPFIGIVKNRPEFIKDTREVAEIIEVKLSLLFDEDSFLTTTVDIPDGNQMKVPAFLLNNHIVWGATAMMVQEIKDILSER